MIFWKFVKSVVRIQRKNRRLNRDLVRSKLTNHYLHNTQFPLKRQILAPKKLLFTQIAIETSTSGKIQMESDHDKF